MSLYERLLTEENAALGSHDYIEYHRRRFEYVAAKCREFCPRRETKVLDIGRSHLSRLLLDSYDSVTTLGLALAGVEGFGHAAGMEEIAGHRRYAGHLIFDLNDAQTAERIGSDQKFDLIVFAETIEHLYTAPELVLGVLTSLLAPDGLIICQTPNAVALHKRLVLMAGRNPFERLRINAGNRGHIREYTRRELIEIGNRAGLETVAHEFRDYFGITGGPAKRLAGRALKVVARMVPSLARGQTIVYRQIRES